MDFVFVGSGLFAAVAAVVAYVQLEEEVGERSGRFWWRTQRMHG